MKTWWTQLPVILGVLALASEPVLLIPGSYFSGIGAAEMDRLAEALDEGSNEVRAEVARARIGRELQIRADDARHAFVFRTRRDGHYQVRSDSPSLSLSVGFIEPGSGRLRRVSSADRSGVRMTLGEDVLIYVEVRGADRLGSRTGNLMVSDPLRTADLSAEVREVIGQGWSQWGFDPEHLVIVDPGQPVTGHLELGGSHWYLVEASSEVPFRVNLDSDDFDPYIELWEVSGDGIGASRTNDDGGSGTNSMLRFRPAARTSHVVIKARGYGEDDEGEYTLRVRQPTPRDGGWDVQSIAEDEGLFIDDLRDGSIGRIEYGYMGPAEEIFYLYDVTGSVEVDLTSDDFDTYVEVWAVDLEGGFFAGEATNDDGGEDQNSRLSFDVGTRSQLLVKVRGYSGNGSGNFQLLVR